jgi:hypothetical protein
VERYGSCHSGEIRMGSMSRHQASLKNLSLSTFNYFEGQATS